MTSLKFLITIFLIGLIISSCHKKNYPSKTPSINTDSVAANTKRSDSLLARKAALKRHVKVPVPKMISVNDSAAHKSVDGRLYYDVLGHRYWRNYKDGKYYLFNKSMFSDPAFKNPDK
ncbi:MAG: hypothetical protein M3Z92_14075 [Bacteroidota bacterium]|nr:hypothetical protein [Bacteroidota bacterium]